MCRKGNLQPGLALIVCAWLWLAAGCSSHGNQPDPGDQTAFPDAGAVQQQNEQRLDPAPGGAVGALGIAGTITLQGLTLLDDHDVAVPAAQANTHLMAQLIDEEDDILAFKSPAADGKYALSVYSPTLALRLRVMGTVAEDLDGDGQGNDKFKQDVPVQLVSGKTVKVDLRLKLARQTDMQPVLWPANGLVLLCDLARSDGNGSFSSFYGTYFAGGFVVITADGDRLLEDGDDLRQPDADRNGWPDPSEAVYGNPALAETSLSGIVTSVDLAAQTLIVRSPDQVNTVVFVSPFCAIEAFSDSGDFYGSIPLTTELLGKAVTVKGQLGPGGIMAQWIVYRP